MEEGEFKRSITLLRLWSRIRERNTRPDLQLDDKLQRLIIKKLLKHIPICKHNAKGWNPSGNYN
jgi:hypothetical protein